MKRWFDWFAFVGLACLLAFSGAAPGAPALVTLASGPLGAGGARVHPNLLLNLSLTYAAAGAAYRGSGDYSASTDYAGYFNGRMCYAYPSVGSGAAAMPDLNESSGHFFIVKAADARHECGGDAFSGNFMNWATASTLDVLRYALTGGDRVIDRPDLTVLQRAYLPGLALNPEFHANPAMAYFPVKSIVGAARVTPFKVPVLYVLSCANRVWFSTSAAAAGCAGAAAPPVSEPSMLGQYLVRVRVCDGADAASRADLCQRYGSQFKPDGAIQQYSATLRFGAMGYLTERGAGDANLYGGVLRAPLGYVGPTMRAAPGFSVRANGQAEWNGATGVLHPAPAGDPATAGVINYINRLGRSKSARLGAYKTDDPLGELYYEALRYLQGRQPTAGASSASNALYAAGGATSDDGLPLLSSWADPVTAACQRNAILTIGNVNTSLDRYLPGNTRVDRIDSARAPEGGVAPALDVMQWSGKVGAFEADPGGRYGNLAVRSRLLDLALMDTGAAGRGSYYMAGLAYWAHTQPIRPGQAGGVDNYAIDLDTGGNGVLDDSNPRPIKPRDSQLYLAAKYGGFVDRNGDANPFQSIDARGAKVNDNSEWSSAGGGPDHYFLGSDGARLIAAVRAIAADANATRATLAGVTLMSDQLAPGKAYLFQSDYDQASWSGNFKRMALTMDAGGEVRIGSAPLWNAGDLLSGSAGRPPKPAPALRQIYTWGIKPDQSAGTVQFAWDALSGPQRAMLDAAPGAAGAVGVPGVSDGLGRARLDYLRGGRTRELGQPGGVFRRRAGVLGDAINSAPVYVGPASPAIQGAGYGAFHERTRQRRAAVYVGANDGMLHAFDAADGSELFAYVPNALLADLNQLTNPAYLHRPYADGSPGTGEAFFNGNWKTVLVSGMGGGAQGVFALDVTNPADFAGGAGALWEFTDRDDPAMGNLSAPPLIAKFKTGTALGVPQTRYFAVVASGLNNYADDGQRRFVADGRAALFLLALDKPASVAWKLGLNYYKLTLPLPDSGSSMANGLTTPALVYSAEGVVRIAYAADLQGNLWRLDFSGDAPWPAAFGAAASARPLFVARDGAGARQPVTQSPRVVFAPDGGYLVLFGTGKLLEESDTLPANFTQQSFYAVHDPAADARGPSIGRRDLAARTLSGAPDSAAGYTVTGPEFVYRASEAGGKKGWYLDFPHPALSGERSVSAAVVNGGNLFFNSVVLGADACAAPSARSYALAALTGFALGADGAAVSGSVAGASSQLGAPGSPVVLETGTVTGMRNPTGRASATKKYTVYNFGSNGAKGAAGKTGAASMILPARRMSWREVANWQELHEKAVK
jgi:type IV pilus assembly protein PilY1